jgi:hypothetical protein
MVLTKLLFFLFQKSQEAEMGDERGTYERLEMHTEV